VTAKLHPKDVSMSQTLKAWIHWVKKNPIDDDQLQHALETERVLNALTEATARLEMAVKALEEIKLAATKGDETSTELECHHLAEEALAEIKGMG
jgi:hypothetical protein